MPRSPEVDSLKDELSTRIGGPLVSSIEEKLNQLFPGFSNNGKFPRERKSLYLTAALLRMTSQVLADLAIGPQIGSRILAFNAMRSALSEIQKTYETIIKPFMTGEGEKAELPPDVRQDLDKINKTFSRN